MEGQKCSSCQQPLFDLSRTNRRAFRRFCCGVLVHYVCLRNEDLVDCPFCSVSAFFDLRTVESARREPKLELRFCLRLRGRRGRKYSCSSDPKCKRHEMLWVLSRGTNGLARPVAADSLLPSNGSRILPSPILQNA